MRFSVYSEMQHWPGKSAGRLYAEVAEQIVHADRMGYSAYAIVEHPFFAMEQLAATPYEEMIAGDIVWVGTPDDVIERIEQTRELCPGLSEVAITVNPGGFEHWKAIKTQELFADRVMPHFETSKERAVESVALG
jgi:hypothetical protein